MKKRTQRQQQRLDAKRAAKRSVTSTKGDGSVGTSKYATKRHPFAFAKQDPKTGQTFLIWEDFRGPIRAERWKPEPTPFSRGGRLRHLLRTDPNHKGRKI